jgi:hypothetical protein
MQQKASVPVIVGAVIVVVILVALLAKSFMGSPATNTEQTKFPDFIDPATGKPKAGQMGSGQAAPVGGRPAPPPGMGGGQGQ